MCNFFQIPSDLVVKSQVTDIIGLLLQLVRHPNGVPRSCHHRKSRGTVLSTSAVQWATTKFNGVWKNPKHLALEQTYRHNSICSMPYQLTRRATVALTESVHASFCSHPRRLAGWMVLGQDSTFVGETRSHGPCPGSAWSR